MTNDKLTQNHFIESSTSSPIPPCFNPPWLQTFICCVSTLTLFSVWISSIIICNILLVHFHIIFRSRRDCLHEKMVMYEEDSTRSRIVYVNFEIHYVILSHYSNWMENLTESESGKQCRHDTEKASDGIELTFITEAERWWWGWAWVIIDDIFKRIMILSQDRKDEIH